MRLIIITLLLANIATAEVTEAVAKIQGLGTPVAGLVLFTNLGSAGVKVDIQMTGVTPGEHGFHVHQFGDCSAADGSSAGGHFSVGTHPHAHRESAERHIGDLGNLLADSEGKIQTSFVDTKISLVGENSILGRGLILHADKDDYTTQPTGNAGGRIACAVIGVKK